MAFWGVEVNPGKPITHSCDKPRGRLRISLVTLGFGDSLKSSVLQCNVGKRSPILLCILLPGKTESSHVELEFQEADDVVFSVIGPRSIYLSGYYVQNRQSNDRTDTESYGVDIENTQTDGSNYNSGDDDGYEDSFMNDDELHVSQRSPFLHGKGLEEITPEKDKQKEKRGRRKLHKRRVRVMESDSDESTPKTLYELDLDVTNRDEKTTTCEAGEKIDHITVEMDDEAKDDGALGSETKKNVDPLDISHETERGTQPALDEQGTESDGKYETRLRLLLGKIIFSPQIWENQKKKRKECPLIEETSEIQTDNEDPSAPTEHAEHEAAETSVDLMGVGEDQLVTAPELNSANHQKKKKRSEQYEGANAEIKEERIESNMSPKPELLANENQPGKISRKKKKTQEKKDLIMSASQMSVNQGNEDEDTKIVAIDTRTLSNGLTILGSGPPPGGKVAVPGKKFWRSSSSGSRAATLMAYLRR